MYGWDHTIPMERPEFETSTNMKVVGLILLLTRELWSTGKSVIIDSGFCVLKGLMEMRKRKVYGGELIKKRCYWPKGGYGDGI